MAKIMLVDESSEMAQLCAMACKREGHQLLHADDRVNAYQVMLEEHPELVILDANLPGDESGVLLKKIKQKFPHTPVLIMHGFDADEQARALAAEATASIQKPFKMIELLGVIDDILTTQNGEKYSSPASGRLESNQQERAIIRKNLFIKYCLLIVILAAVGAEIYLMYFSIGSSKIENRVYAIPYSHPTAITYDGKHIWIADWFTQTFYKHTIDGSFTIASTYFMHDAHPTGLTFDGRNIWSADSWSKLILKHALGESMSITERFQSPAEDSSGLYWDGTYLWICDMQTAKIFKTRITEEGFMIIKEYDSPCSVPIGLFFKEPYYWVGDADTNCLYRLDKDFQVRGIYRIDLPTEKDYRLSSVCWDGKSVWLCFDDSREVHRITFKSLRRLTF